MTKEQILSLMEKATMNQWIAVTEASTGNFTGAIKQVLIGLPLWPTVATCTRKEDAPFIAALPDIAQTALDALRRVEELEKELEKLERRSNRAIKDEGDSAFIAGMRRAEEINGTYERGEM